MPDRIVRTATELVAAASALREELGTNLWWRGHADIAWDLTPGIFRNPALAAQEAWLCRDFMRRAPSVADSLPADADVLGWAALMQHHALPTRLLDWSQSPLIATYFAVRIPIKEEIDGAVFCIDAFRLQKEQIAAVGTRVPHRTLLDTSHKPKSELEAIACVVPTLTHRRMVVQHSAMTVHALPTPLNAFASAANWLRRIVIPGDAKRRLVGELRELGISESVVFPDMDGLCREIANIQYVTD